MIDQKKNISTSNIDTARHKTSTYFHATSRTAEKSRFLEVNAGLPSPLRLDTTHLLYPYSFNQILLPFLCLRHRHDDELNVTHSKTRLQLTLS